LFWYHSNAFETLSTLKFAQRAKLIQNTVIHLTLVSLPSLSEQFSGAELSDFQSNSYRATSAVAGLSHTSALNVFCFQAIVNEDASGDVTALHRQIQQMKVYSSAFE